MERDWNELASWQSTKVSASPSSEEEEEDTTTTSTREDGAITRISDGTVVVLAQRFKALLKYMEKFEEVRNKEQMFSKYYQMDDDKSLVEEDWSTDPYLHMSSSHSSTSSRQPKKSAGETVPPPVPISMASKGPDESSFGVILTSYEYRPLRDQIRQATTGGSSSSATWLTIPRALEKKYTPNEDVKQYLAFLQKWDREHRFHGCETVHDMIPLLSRDEIEKDLPTTTGEDDRKAKALHLLLEIMEYHTNEPFQSLQPAYQKLFDWQASAESDDHDLILGFGHVRVLAATRKNNSQYEKRLVSGPLLEVPVQVHLDPHYRLDVKPKVHAEIEINEEVMAAMVSTGICNNKVMEKLYALAKTTPAANLDPFQPSSFAHFLQIASRLQSGTKIRRATDFNVHDPPENLEKVVITDASCLFSRKKKNTIFSNDARALGEAFRDGKLFMTEPIKGLLSGPDYCHETTCNGCESNRLVYALPSSERQRQIGIRLLSKGEPVVNVVGPPGTGKTHSIANIAATALSIGKTICVCSSNDKALKALMDKLPDDLQALALDMSSVKDQDVSQLHFALDEMIGALLEIKLQDETSFLVTKFEVTVKELKEKLHGIYETLRGTTVTSRDLLANGQSSTMIDSASAIAVTAPWLVTAIFAGKIKDIPGILENLKVFNRPVSLGHTLDHFLTTEERVQDLQDRVRKQIEKLRNDSGGGSRPVFSFTDTPVVDDKHLIHVKVDGKKPENGHDWEIVLAALLVVEKCILPCREAKDDIIEQGENFSFRVSQTLVDLMNTSAELENTFACLDDETKKALLSIFESSVNSYDLQAEYQKLTSKIQKTESELVFYKVIRALNEKLGKGEISTLKKMSQRLGKMTKSHLAAGGTRGARYLEDFSNLFKEASKFMPFLVMTIEQASQFLAPDHVCDIGIIDEASQSSCTAINFMARCKQMLVVGDDKQVSPSTNGVSEESIRTLKQSLPGISTDEQLLPDYSFFDLTQATFSCGDICLNEHFRCDPDIIAISNKLYYNGSLVPMRLRGQSKAVQVKYVKGGVKDKKGKNDKEAEEVAKDVVAEIRRTITSPQFQTIAVISMGGPQQHKRIQQLVEERITDIIDKFGSDVVDRHKILYGTSKECQGNERDIAFLSFVASTPEKKGSGKPAKLKQDDNWKESNVALTRAKNRMVLYRSFELKDLHPNDTRNRIFRAISSEGQGVGAVKSDTTSGDAPTFNRHHLVYRTVNALSNALKTKGYLARRHGGKVWSDALCIESSSDNGSSPLHVLLHIESCGETEKEWMKMFDEQLSLERAGRLCLRVDCLSLLLNFDDTFHGVLCYLEKKDMSKSHKRDHPKGPASSTGTAHADQTLPPNKRLCP